MGRQVHVLRFQHAGLFKSNTLLGGIITSYCSSFENIDGHGHGTKLEATCMVVSNLLLDSVAN